MRMASVTLAYELPVTESGVVQGMVVWCPACRCPVVQRVEAPAGAMSLQFYCPNTGCRNHRKAAQAPIRLRVEVAQ